MAKRFRVLVFPSAQADFRETKDYFEKILKVSARPLLSKALSHIDAIESNPLIHPLVKDPFLASLGYRMIPLDNFLLFYVVDGKDIQIHRFLYGKRDYLNIL